MKIIDEWNIAWKWASVRCMAVALAVQGTWAVIPEDMKQHIPPIYVKIVTMGLLITGIIGRITVKEQKDSSLGADQNPPSGHNNDTIHRDFSHRRFRPFRNTER